MSSTNVKKIILLLLIPSILTIFTACEFISPFSDFAFSTKGIISGIVADSPLKYVKEGSGADADANAEKDESYLPVPFASVTITDSNGISHITYTNLKGYYQFGDLTVRTGAIIEMSKKTSHGTKVYKDFIPVDISSEENYYVGITGVLETARALVIEALLNSGEEFEQIDWESINQNKDFDKLMELVSQAQREGKDFNKDHLIQKQIELIIKNIIDTADVFTPPPLPPPPQTSPPKPPLPPDPPLSSEKNIINYQFKAEDNDALLSDIIGIINKETYMVEFTVPYDTDITNLIANYGLSDSAEAYIDEVIQKSSVTSNDFTNPIIYTIIAEDGSKQDWRVLVDREIGPLHHFTITGYPESVVAGEDFGNNDITVTAYDVNNKIKNDYQGKIYFLTTDSTELNKRFLKLPYTIDKKYAFIEDDSGTHSFPGTGFVLVTAGEQTISVTDGEIIASSEPLAVTAAELKLFEFDKIGDQVVGIPFNITITAMDKFGNTITSYNGTNTLEYFTDKISPNSTGNFNNGIWSGEVTLHWPQKYSQENVIIYTKGDGVKNSSNPFNVSLP